MADTIIPNTNPSPSDVNAIGGDTLPTPSTIETIGGVAGGAVSPAPVTNVAPQPLVDTPLKSAEQAQLASVQAGLADVRDEQQRSYKSLSKDVPHQLATYSENVLRTVNPMADLYRPAVGRVIGHNALIWDEVRGRLAAYFVEGELPLDDEPSQHGVKVMYSLDGKVGHSWTTPVAAVDVEAGWSGVRDLGVGVINGDIYLQTSQANDNLTNQEIAVYRSQDGEAFTKQGVIPLESGKNRGYIKTFLPLGDKILAFGWQGSNLSTSSYRSYVWESDDYGVTWAVKHDLGAGNETTAVRFKGRVYAFVRGISTMTLVNLGVNVESIESVTDITANIPNYHPQYAAVVNLNDRFLAIGFRNNYDQKQQQSVLLTDLDAFWKSHLIGGWNFGQSMLEFGDNTFGLLGSENTIKKLDGSGTNTTLGEDMRITYTVLRVGGSVGAFGHVGSGRIDNIPEGVLVWENGVSLTGQADSTVGSPETIRSSYYGESVRQYGNGDSDVVGADSDFNFLHDGSAFTLGVWVKRSSILAGDSGRILCSAISKTNTGILLRWEKSGGGDILRFYVHNGSGTEAVNVGIGVPLIGTNQNPEDWVLYVLRYDGTSYHVQLGVNQSLAYFKPMTGAAGVGNADEPLHIGGWTSGHSSEPDALQIGRVFIEDSFLEGEELAKAVHFLEGGV